MQKTLYPFFLSRYFFLFLFFSSYFLFLILIFSYFLISYFLFLITYNLLHFSFFFLLFRFIVVNMRILEQKVVFVMFIYTPVCLTHTAAAQEYAQEHLLLYCTHDRVTYTLCVLYKPYTVRYAVCLKRQKNASRHHTRPERVWGLGPVCV